MATIVEIETPVLKRFLFLGPTGTGKSKMINCCYNRSVDPGKLNFPADVAEQDRIIGKTSSISNHVDQRNKIVYVDTIGYGDIRFHHSVQAFILFFRELICYSSIGFNWIFLFLRYSQMSEDTFLYLQTLQNILGEKAFSRCTIVFTHCKDSAMTKEKCIEANKQHEGIVKMLNKVNNVIFGDMDTTILDSDPDYSNEEERQSQRRVQQKKRQRFVDQMIQQINQTDNKTLILETHWYQHYTTKFMSFMGYLWEKCFGRSNELSKLYKLANEMKNGIPVTIYYEECSICLELIVEVVGDSPKTCITSCGHIFHFDCLKKAFDEKKRCPNCRKDLRKLPEKVKGYLVGMKEVQDPLK